MDGESPDLGRVHAIATSVDRAFSTLGGIRTANGGPAVIGRSPQTTDKE